MTGLHDTNPRKRFEAVSALAELRPLPGRALLEAADDYHPFVRAVAQYALLHAGDPCSSLKIRFDDERFLFHSYGGGEVRIGPLTLLRIPLPMAVDLSVSIDRLNIDPFQEDSEFAFLPMSPALFADDLFAAKAAVDWLELLAYLREIAVASADLAHHAESRPRLVPLARQLSLRAAGYSAMGRLLSSDLGLPWGSYNLSKATGGNFPAMDQTYTDLRHLFSRANQARTLRLAHLANDSRLDVSQMMDQVSMGGKAVGIQIDRFEGSAFDDTVEGGQRFIFINSSRNVRAIEDGTVHGIEIGRVQGSWHELPLTVHVHDSMTIEDAINCEVSSVRMHRLASGVCPWRIRASVMIRRFLNSRYCGVAIEEYEPESESGLISS